MKVIGYVLGAGLCVSLVLGVYWLLWSLWTWVVPQVWPTGPESFINPGFWLFSGAWLLITMIGRSIFGGGK